MSNLIAQSFKPFVDKNELPVAVFDEQGNLNPSSARFVVQNDKLLCYYKIQKRLGSAPDAPTEFQVKRKLWGNLKPPSPNAASWNDNPTIYAAHRKIILAKRAKLRAAGIPGA
ncbi:MAG: hypothetical protein A2992_06795 [Elusimicrobia bacterium RIFCSPLOWO2_01_FULL_59_12]|nr:MAG: hypothetical protein A2992_06795 [Elusimicrobia bacterium RIFCSPLOWO2_01_FULL_59_12]